VRTVSNIFYILALITSFASCSKGAIYRCQL